MKKASGEHAISKLKAFGFHCQQCGRCCLSLGFELELSIEETKSWQESHDLVFSNFGYRFLEDFMSIIPETGQADLWFHPDTGDELHRCPFLRKVRDNYRCLIYNLRPESCRYFPINMSSGGLDIGWAEFCPEVKRLMTS
jgi:Fe-S-cluster containining protein